MASNSGEGLSEKDENIRHIVRLFQPLIAEITDPRQMLTSAAGTALSDILGKGNVQQIQREEDSKGTLSAANLLFEKLEHCNVRGVWTAFYNMLRNGDFQRILDILEGKSAEDDECKRRMLEILSPIIHGRVDPVLLVDCLLSKSCITNEDYQNIKAEQDNHGKTAASMVLLERLLRSRIRDWYQQFMLALNRTGSSELMNEIDPEFWPSYMKLRDKGEMENIEGAGASCSCGDADMTSVKSYDEEDPEEMEIKYNYVENNLDVPNYSPAKIAKKDVMESLNTCTDSSSRVQCSLNIETSENTEMKETAVSGSRGTPCTAGAETVQSGSHDTLGTAGAEKAGELSETDITNLLETTSDGEEESQSQSEEIKLRKYQEELVQAGLQGKNCVIVAPTGSGKTMVALKIMKEHFSSGSGRGGIRKIAFLVNNVALASQQATACQERIPEQRTQLMCGGHDEQIAVSLLLPEFEIFVMTAQILLDALKKKDIPSLSQFTLIVFDECHHTTKKHPFNAIMAMYLYKKLECPGDAFHLPQIIGLTASMGVGKAKTIAQAKEHIKTLCANLDAEEICTVKDPESVRALCEYVPVPTEEIQSVEGRRNDRFAAFLQKWMEHIEEKIKTEGNATPGPRLEDAPRGKRDSQEYKQWISKVRRDVAIRYDAGLRYYCMACIEFAEICNDALMINRDVRTRDALEHLRNKIDQKEASHPVERELVEYFKGKQTYLDQVSSNPISKNPKLEKLKQMIIEAYEKKPDSRGIIFVKTRDLVLALVRWMRETPELAWLNPNKLVGQTTEEEGGMTQNQQRDVILYFKNGDHKILVATSVAEEGLDIQKCNLVIRYDYVTNEIAMVQARGRARADDSKYISLVTHGRGTDAKEQLNAIRENMMNKAIRELQDDITRNLDQFHQDIRRLQEESRMDRALAGVRAKTREFEEGDFQLRCKKCDQFACFTSDLRKFEETHHAVIAEDFVQHSNITPHPKPTNHTLAKRGKVWCRKCGYDWGIIALYHEVNFFIIKIDSFVIIDFQNRKSTCRKWRDAHFEVVNLTSSDNEIVNKVGEDIASCLAKC